MLSATDASSSVAGRSSTPRGTALTDESNSSYDIISTRLTLDNGILGVRLPRHDNLFEVTTDVERSSTLSHDKLSVNEEAGSLAREVA